MIKIVVDKQAVDSVKEKGAAVAQEAKVIGKVALGLGKRLANTVKEEYNKAKQG